MDDMCRNQGHIFNVHRVYFNIFFSSVIRAPALSKWQQQQPLTQFRWHWVTAVKSRYKCAVGSVAGTDAVAGRLPVVMVSAEELDLGQNEDCCTSA